MTPAPKPAPRVKRQPAGLLRKTRLTPGGPLRHQSVKRVAAAQESGLPVLSSLRGSQRLAPRSKQRAKDERAYARRRLAWLVEHPFCAACGKPTEDLHHSAGRDGWRLLYEPWWVPLCRVDHDWCGANPEAAIAAGYSRRRHDKPTGDAA